MNNFVASPNGHAFGHCAKWRWLAVVVAVFFLSACVTINVYFPAAEAESAAGRLVEEIIGGGNERKADDVPEGNPQGSWQLRINPLDWIIPTARAQANIDISSPVINEIKQRMRQRYENHLKTWLDAGVVGFNNRGFVEVRSQGSLPLKERQLVKKVVADENRDRQALYRELAVANGHPEWEEEIRRVFVKQWIAKARAGWFYQAPDGSWVKKI